MRVQNKRAMRFRWTEGFELTENLFLSLMGVTMERPSLALELLHSYLLFWAETAQVGSQRVVLNSTLESKMCHRSPGLSSHPVPADAAMPCDPLWGHGWVLGNFWNCPCFKQSFPDKRVLSRTGKGEAALTQGWKVPCQKLKHNKQFPG